MDKEAPKIGIRTEIIENISRISFEQQPGNNIFVGEYRADLRKFKFSWPCSKSKDDFKKTIETYGKTIWTENENVVSGSSLNWCFTFDPMSEETASRAGVQVEMNDIGLLDPYVERIPKKVVKIASETVSQGVCLPSNLAEELIKFAKSSIEMKRNPAAKTS